MPKRKTATGGSKYLCKLAQNDLRPIIVDVLPETNDVPVLERALVQADLDEDLFFILRMPGGEGCPTVPSFEAIDKDVLNDAKTRVMRTIDERWENIPISTREALVEWYNTAEEDLDLADRATLAELHEENRFTHGNCRHCDATYHRAYPDSWDLFQGCHNDEGIGELCADCSRLYSVLKEAAGE